MIENFSEWAKGAVGKTEKEVTDAVIEGGGTARVVRRDGEPYIVTMDLRANRANLTIENGIVTKITFG